MRWLDRFFQNRAPRIYSLFHPVYPLEVAFAKLEPGNYVMVFNKLTISRAAVHAIGFPQLGDTGSGVRIVKVLVTGDPKDAVALFKISGTEIL